MYHINTHTQLCFIPRLPVHLVAAPSAPAVEGKRALHTHIYIYIYVYIYIYIYTCIQ